VLFLYSFTSTNLLPLPCPPSVLQAPGKPLLMSVKLQGTDAPLLLRLPRAVDENDVVGDIIEAIIAKFKLDAAPQQLKLFKLNDKGIRSSNDALKPMQTLAEADLLSAMGGLIKLEVVRTEATTYPTTCV
jgi:hypothetical protein